MSMLNCLECGEPCDTDFDLDGVWSDEGYVCTRCTELDELYAADALQAEEEHERTRHS